MKIKNVDGVAYFTIPIAAKYLGMSTTALRRIALSEGLGFVNFRRNGTLWVTVESIKALRAKQAVARVGSMAIRAGGFAASEA